MNTPSEPTIAKVTVNLPWKVWTALQRVAEDGQISKTEALRRAISTEVFRHRIEAEGGHLVVRRANGDYEMVHFPY